MKKKQSYKVYDHVYYSHVDPAVPCSLIFESEDLNEVKEYVNRLDTKKNIYFVFSSDGTLNYNLDNNETLKVNFLFDTTKNG